MKHDNPAPTPWARYQSLLKRYPRELDGLFSGVSPAEAQQKGLGILEAQEGWLWLRDLHGERPIYLNDALKRRIEGYFALAAKNPASFRDSSLTPLIMDRHTLLRFEAKTGRSVGLVFDNSPYFYGIADLIDGQTPYIYGRVLYPDRRSSGTVMIPRLICGEEPPLFGLLDIFRHAIRARSGGEFPRGFQEPSITPAENAAKELREELGIPSEQLISLTLLGRTRADTGLSSGTAQIYLADIAGPIPQAAVGSEGIAAAEWLPEDELQRRIRDGMILDGFTQTAYLQYLLWKNRPAD